MEAGVFPSSVIMTGNEADLNVGDMVRMLASDPNTDVIAVYSEGINDGPGLINAIKAAYAAGKPVVMMKVGRSEVGGAAARSHTASIAGDDAVVSAVLEELGVVRVRTTEEMIDILQLASRRIFPVDNTLGVVTVSGGAGVIISDAAEDLGIRMPEMPAAAQARMLEMLPICSPRNPVDVTAQFVNDTTLVTPFTEAMMSEGGYATLVAFFSYAAASPVAAEALLQQLGDLRKRHPDRLYVMVGRGDPKILARYEEAGFSVFGDPNRAVAAIAAMGRFGRALAGKSTAPAPKVAAITLPPTTPTEAQAKALLAEAGIPSAPERACADAEAAVLAARAIGFPVVLKILSPDILHKSEIGGVLLNVASEGAVREASPCCSNAPARQCPMRASKACWWPSSSRAAWNASWASTAIRSSVRLPCSVLAACSWRCSRTWCSIAAVRAGCGREHDSFDQGCAAAAGRSWAAGGGYSCAGAHAVAALGVCCGCGAAVAVD